MIRPPVIVDIHGEGQTVSHIDAASRRPTHTIDLGTDVGQLLAFDGVIWVAGDDTVTLIEIP
jgi:hypothetical protein